METDEPALDDSARDAATGIAVVYRDDGEALGDLGLGANWELGGIGEKRAGCEFRNRYGVLDGIAEAATT